MCSQLTCVCVLLCALFLQNGKSNEIYSFVCSFVCHWITCSCRFECGVVLFYLKIGVVLALHLVATSSMRIFVLCTTFSGCLKSPITLHPHAFTQKIAATYCEMATFMACSYHMAYIHSSKAQRCSCSGWNVVKTTSLSGRSCERTNF